MQKCIDLAREMNRDIIWLESGKKMKGQLIFIKNGDLKNLLNMNLLAMTYKQTG